jgi:viroplasmin and RNaseH domain-containing protein
MKILIIYSSESLQNEDSIIYSSESLHNEDSIIYSSESLHNEDSITQVKNFMIRILSFTRQKAFILRRESNEYIAISLPEWRSKSEYKNSKQIVLKCIKVQIFGDDGNESKFDSGEN